jgi:hypothetical protein
MRARLVSMLRLGRTCGEYARGTVRCLAIATGNASAAAAPTTTPYSGLRPYEVSSILHSLLPRAASLHAGWWILRGARSGPLQAARACRDERVRGTGPYP